MVHEESALLSHKNAWYQENLLDASSMKVYQPLAKKIELSLELVAWLAVNIGKNDYLLLFVHDLCMYCSGMFLH